MSAMIQPTSKAITDAEALRKVQADIGDLAERISTVTEQRHLVAIIEAAQAASDALHTGIGVCVGDAVVINKFNTAAMLLSDIQSLLDSIGYVAEDRLDEVAEDQAKGGRWAFEKLIERAVRREEWDEARRLIKLAEVARY